MMVRRKFLGALLAAPVAVPVAAKEAAASMGPKSALGGGFAGATFGGPAGIPMSEESGSWIKRALATFGTARKSKEVAQRAEDAARVLDPDLAALRSVSPAWAYRRQRDRMEVRLAERERQWLLWQQADEMQRKIGL